MADRGCIFLPVAQIRAVNAANEAVWPTIPQLLTWVYGEYCSIVSEMRERHLRLAFQPTPYTASIDGKEVRALMMEGDCILHLDMSAGQPTQFEVVST